MRSQVSVAVILSVVSLACVMGGPYDWMGRDNFDDIIARMDRVTWENCASMDANALMLNSDTVTNKVMFNKLKTVLYYKNRTALEQMHTVSLGNSYKYSFLFQRYNESNEMDFQPSLFYYYMGLTADVSGNNGYINGSAAFFDKHLFYPNFLNQVPLNNTVKLFGPRAYRIDDTNDPSNWLREPTNHTFTVEDYGAGPLWDYTSPQYMFNPWYSSRADTIDWLPQPLDESDEKKNEQLSVSIRRANSSGVYLPDDTQNFFGPPQPGQDAPPDEQPTKFTRPYFDCGKSNKWIVSAVTPIYDVLPRYPYDTVTGQPYSHIQKYRRVGVTTVDIDFLRIDFNPCRRDNIFPESNYFGGTARCKLDSTLCRPLHGYGFLRGAYRCECRPLYRYPVNIQGPYYGWDIEKATDEEYKGGFHCLKNEDLYQIPQLQGSQIDNAGYDVIPGVVIGKRSVDTVVGDSPVDAVAEEGKRRAHAKRSIAGVRLPEHFHLRESERFRRTVTATTMTVRYTRAELEAGASRRRVVRDILDEHKQGRDKVEADASLEEKRKKRRAGYKAFNAKSRKKRSTFDAVSYNRVLQFFLKKNNAELNTEICAQLDPEDLILPGEVRFGVDENFQAQASSAVRIANFLSNFLQNINGQTNYGLLDGDSFLTDDQVLAEVLGPMMADPKIMAMAVYFDENSFTERDGSTRELFAPMAYREVTTGGQDVYKAADLTGEPQMYSRSDWFQAVKRRWSYNIDGLMQSVLNPWIRSDHNGTYLLKHEEYPLLWKTPGLKDGVWSDPYFNCFGFVKDWILTYRVPFFGRNKLSKDVEFRGLVAVDVLLDRLDIHQCASDFYEPNAFMGTARCDYETTECKEVPMLGFFDGPGYRCDCKQGYEYPWEANEYFYTGDLINLELARKRNGETTRYDRLKCRMAAAPPTIHVSLALFSLLLLLSHL